MPFKQQFQTRIFRKTISGRTLCANVASLGFKSGNIYPSGGNNTRCFEFYIFSLSQSYCIPNKITLHHAFSVRNSSCHRHLFPSIALISDIYLRYLQCIQSSLLPVYLSFSRIFPIVFPNHDACSFRIFYHVEIIFGS